MRPPAHGGAWIWAPPLLTHHCGPQAAGYPMAITAVDGTAVIPFGKQTEPLGYLPAPQKTYLKPCAARIRR